MCYGHNVTKSNSSQEIIRVKVLPQSTPSDTSTGSSISTTATPTTPKPKDSPTAKSGIQAHEIEEEDDNFHNDRLPALSEDEYNNLSEDANPLHFLKQQPLDLENEESQQKPESQTESKPDSEVMAPQSSGSPIYITIPIYISTGGKLPITLTIGDQDLSLKKTSGSNRKNPSTKSPNSFFNRLLQQIESPKRGTTNRHRSQLKSHVYAMKEKDNQGNKDEKKLKVLLHSPMQ
ncbi:GM25415 [Drosophila sechellia]|uniref:GM25415 n=1 Tax=Drosophila sechellia TaxID=7238 RepID=B4HGR6_DROSE|nr:GM25415 [Drosophila sechellia]